AANNPSRSLTRAQPEYSRFSEALSIEDNIMNKPILLDLYCCAGGAARGYHNAGFEVVGVDIDPRKNYPYACYQGDALQTLDILLEGKVWQGYRLTDFS